MRRARLQSPLSSTGRKVVGFLPLALALPAAALGQETAAWSLEGEESVFHTFSIAAVDLRTGETGVAVTTRVPCVGNAVPWVRVGVGAVATQAWTRIEYGPELLDLLSTGARPTDALSRALAADSMAARRQIGVAAADGSTAQHTGDEMIPWAGHRSGIGYAVQGNLLVGPEVLDAVAENFEAAANAPLHLADRLIAALEAGEAAGGDARKGRLQSAAVLVADPREGRAQRPNGVTVDIHVCEHPAPVAELRRVYRAVSRTLGYRTLERFSGPDVWQLKLILHALGYYRPHAEEPRQERGAFDYDAETMEAVDAFRRDVGLATAELGSPAGLVDAETVSRLWEALEERGKAVELRRQLLDVTAVRR